MNDPERFLADHLHLTRRFFLRAGGTALVAGGLPLATAAEPTPPELADALKKLEPFFTPPEEFRDVSRGKPVPHSLSEERRREVGLTRETWKLEILSDPDHPATLGKQLTRKDDTALDFDGLLKLGEKHAVRFPKVMTCLNIGCPLGMGIWEGVPVRDVLALTQPKENIRRVFYYGFHNDDPAQIFRSSLPVGRIQEDPYDLPPVILCYKLNGQWLSPKRGGPVRVVVPEAYGFKSVKWLSHLVLTNLYHANDTYANGNNDVDSALKSFTAVLLPPSGKPNKSLPVTGYAQVGIGGLSKVQVWVQPAAEKWPANDPTFTKAPWTDARILPAPAEWGGKLPDSKIPAATQNFDKAGKPTSWPLRLGKVHWATVLPGLPAGDYVLRSRAVDEKGHAQPLPRPFRKSGHCAIEAVSFSIKA